MPLGKASTTSPSSSIFSSLGAIALLRKGLGFERAAPRRAGRGALSMTRLAADLDDVRCHGALLALGGLELDLGALGEALKALAGDIRVMHEEILPTLVGRDEAESLRIVEPLNGSGCHQKNTSLTNFTNG